MGAIYLGRTLPDKDTDSISRSRINSRFDDTNVMIH